MTVAPHRIRRQTWHVHTDSPASAFGLRQALRTQLDTVLTPAIERAFDAQQLGEQVVHIPRLSVTVRLTGAGDVVAEIAEQVEREITAVLRQRVVSKNQREPVRIVTTELTWREILRDYLRSGCLPWHATTIETADNLQQLRIAVERWVTEPESIVNEFGDTPAQLIAASFRLVQLLTPSSRMQLLRDLAMLESTHEPLRELRLGVAALHHVEEYPQLRAIAVLISLRSQDLRPPLSAVVTTLLTECLPIFERAKLGDIEIVKLVARSKDTKTPALPKHLTPSTVSTVAVGTPDPSSGPPSLPLPGQSSHGVQQPAIGTHAGQAATELPASDETDVPGGLLVPMAGLILLHPFIGRLFNTVGIVPTGGKKISVDQLARAAALLHWLAVGSTEMFEFEIPFVKILLGLSPDDHLPIADGLLTADDCTAADAMLAAVIEHWSALGRTSVAGLRRSFVQRRGMLNRSDKGWQLRMESESFDVLLGQLPWGVSIVKLQWMSTPIYVEWPTP